MTYGQLVGDRRFSVQFTGTAPIKDYRTHKIVGTRVPRVDIPAKAGGKYVYMQNVRVPGMLHGRVVRPRGRGAYYHEATLVGVDESSIADIPGARVVRRKDFVGVVAPDVERGEGGGTAARYVGHAGNVAVILGGTVRTFTKCQDR